MEKLLDLISDQDQIDLFRLLANKTATEMDDAFNYYYSVEGNNEIPEALTSTYLAFQLRDNGFKVYPQIQCSGQIDNHLDIAAIHPDMRTVLLVEAKRLYNSGQACLIGRDWLRLQTVSIASELRQVPSDYRYVACLLASTSVEKFRDWWIDPARLPMPDGMRKSENWIDLKHALDCSFLNHTERDPLARLNWTQRLHLLFSFVTIPPARA